LGFEFKFLDYFKIIFRYHFLGETKNGKSREEDTLVLSKKISKLIEIHQNDSSEDENKNKEAITYFVKEK
jgi:hypothetical protein